MTPRRAPVGRLGRFGLPNAFLSHALLYSTVRGLSLSPAGVMREPQLAQGAHARVAVKRGCVGVGRRMPKVDRGVGAIQRHGGHVVGLRGQGGVTKPAG